MDLGGGANLLLPLDPAPGGGEIPATGIDEALEADVGGGEGDKEEGPQEHGAGGSEATVDLTVHVVSSLDLELAWCGREKLFLQRWHFLVPQIEKIKCGFVPLLLKWFRCFLIFFGWGNWKNWIG